MRTLLGISLLALALAVLPSRAAAHGVYVPPFKVDAGFNIYFKIYCGKFQLPQEPWYLFFPAEAQHLSVGPSHRFPNWPPPQNTLNAPGARPLAWQGNAFRPASYFAPQAPSYWYGQ